jgi:hypothetical protein
VRLASVILWLSILSAAEIKPRLPLLSSVFPQGSEAGRTIRVEVLGEYLDRAGSVLFLDPSIRGKVLQGSYTRLMLEFTLDADAALGPHYFRVVSPRGASNILLFRVGDQPHINEREPNSTFEEAQEVPAPVTINGRLDTDGDFDFFKFRAEKGQSWIFDVRSARNGNGLDPALILLDSRGRKLDHSEDVFIWDPFLQYTFSETGLYYLVVQPTHARVDPNFAYQLDIRTAPHLETISPLSIHPGSTVEATLFGAGLRGGTARLWFDAPSFSGEVLDLRGSTARVRIHCPPEAADGPRQLAVLNGGGRSNPATFLVDSTPVHLGGEHITPPTSIAGIARYRQPERFSFDVNEKQTLVFEVRAQRFGSPVDSILRILNASGKEIAVNDDATFAGAQFNKDSLIMRTFDKAGRYYVEMRNLWKTTGEDFPYQLLVRPPKPAFELMLGTDNPYVYAGEKGSLKLTAVRKDGYAGPIAAQVKGLPGVDSVEIPAGKDETEVRFTAPAAHCQVQVLAGKPAWRSVRISSGGGEGATFATVEQATLAVVEKPLFSLEAAASNLNVVRGGSAEFNVTIRRAEGFSEPIRFFFDNLPPGISAEAAMAGPQADHVTIRLQAAKEARLGRFSRVAVLGRAEGGQVQEAPKIAIVID